MCGKSAYDWNTTPHSRERTVAAVTSRPPSSTRPASTRRNPAISLSSVVLPQPDGPMQTTSSPGAISSPMSNTPAVPPG